MVSKWPIKSMKLVPSNPKYLELLLPYWNLNYFHYSHFHCKYIKMIKLMLYLSTSGLKFHLLYPPFISLLSPWTSIKYYHFSFLSLIILPKKFLLSLTFFLIFRCYVFNFLSQVHKICCKAFYYINSIINTSGLLYKFLQDALSHWHLFRGFIPCIIRFCKLKGVRDPSSYTQFRIAILTSLSSMYLSSMFR